MGDEFLGRVMSWNKTMCLNDEMFASQIEQLPDTYTGIQSWSEIFKYHILEEMRSSIKSDLVLIDKKVLRQTSFTVEDRRLILKKDKDQELTRSILVMLVRVEGVSAETKFAVLNCSYDDLHLRRFSLTCPNSGEILNQIVRDNEPGCTEKIWSLYLLLSSTTIPPMRICDGLKSSSKLPISSLLREMLSCKPSSPMIQSKCSMPPETLKLIKALNSSQKNAVSNVINTIMSAETMDSSHIQVILGPPGTGKTNTLATLILTILYQSYLPNTFNRLHVSAPTNQAIVELTKRTLANINKQASGAMTIRCKARHILLVGNRESLNISPDLEEIYLTGRLERLSEGLAMWVSLPHVGKVEMLLRLGSPTTYGKNHLDIYNRNGAKNTDPDLNSFIFCVASILKDLPDSHLTEIDRQHLKKVVGILKNYRSLSIRKAANDPPNAELIAARAQIEYELKSVSSKRISDVAIKFLRLKRNERETEIMKSACVIFSTVSAGGSAPFENQSFDIAIIDEATQLVEASTSIMLYKDLKCLVLAGDNKQLPSTVISTLAEGKGYGRSLFDRLLNANFPTLLLNVQYRMHPAISCWPNKQFYDGKIIDGDNVRSNAFYKYWHSVLPPFSILDVNGTESRLNTGSILNKKEANVIIDVLTKLAKLIQAQSTSIENPGPVIIGILSPYKAQCEHLDKMVRRIGYIDKRKMTVICRTIDGFQGQECDIIILTTVRTNINCDLRFLRDCRRLNVAITRPKYSLLLVGNCDALCTNDVWRSLIESSKKQTIQDESPSVSTSIQNIAAAKSSGSNNKGIQMQLKKKQKGKAQAEAKVSKGTGKVGAIQPCLIASFTQIDIAAPLGIKEQLVKKNKSKAETKAKAKAKAKIVTATDTANASSTQTKIAASLAASNPNDLKIREQLRKKIKIMIEVKANAKAVAKTKTD